MATQSYLIDQITNREIDVIRVANNTAARNSSGLFSLYRDIIKKLEQTPSSKWYRLAADIEVLLQNEMRGVVKEIKADLTEFAPIEARFAENLLVTATTIDTVGRLPASILATFTSAPINHFVSGKKVTTPTVDDLLATLTTERPEMVKKIIRDASLEGKTARQISAEIRKIAVNATRNDIEATTLTAFNHYSNQAKQAVYQQNTDILEGVEIVATLDSRTTFICMSLDGKIFPVNSGPIPPLHYRCRSQRVPIIKEKFRIPIKGATRASEFGPVDSQMTYQGFLKRQPKERQNEILGIERAKAFRRGLPIDKFVNNRNVKLTLDQLRARFPDKF
jgi:SPP1 gp7 family putative phage head morphogenesis protein